MSKPERVGSANERVQDVKLVEEALARAVSDALQDHKRAGNPVPEWRDGRVRWVAPDDIPGVATTLGEARNE